MKTAILIIALLLFVAGCLWLSHIIFDAVMNSNLPPYWKYIILRS